MVGHSPFILKLEEDLKPVLTTIEDRGLIMGKAKMREIISGLRGRRSLAESHAYNSLEIQNRINLNSSAELANLLVSLNIEGSERTKTRSGGVTVAQDVLERIGHPSIEHIIEYRSLTRLISCLESYHDAVGMLDNRLYYKFTNYCPSGRLYTKDMSVQNMPHEGRYAIVPETGKVFVSADYDSFELKVLSALPV